MSGLDHSEARYLFGEYANPPALPPGFSYEIRKKHYVLAIREDGRRFRVERLGKGIVLHEVPETLSTEAIAALRAFCDREKGKPDFFNAIKSFFSEKLGLPWLEAPRLVKGVAA